jgi:hypothetical protein
MVGLELPEYLGKMATKDSDPAANEAPKSEPVES